jgi:hypothetical protein
MPAASVHAGQHLRHVARLDVAPLAGQRTGDLHQAAEIACKHAGSAGSGNVACLSLADRSGDVGIFDGEAAAESATRFGLGHLHEVQAIDAGQQAARRIVDVEFTEAGAGIMVGDVTCKVRIDALDAKHVDEKARQF